MQHLNTPSMIKDHKYKIVVKGVDARRICYPVTKSTYDIIGPQKDIDWYESIFLYSDEHKAKIENSGTAAGITDVYTTKLVWDFDSATNLIQAQADTKELCSRLIERGIDKDAIDVSFSGGKGFAVVLHTNTRFTPEEYRNINLALAVDLKTNDTKIAGDPQRIFRVIGTKHKSGLYKSAIPVDVLMDYSIDDIKEVAKTSDKGLEITTISLPPSIEELRTYKEKVKSEPKFVLDVSEIDFRNKWKGFSNCKYAIAQGFFDEGNRSHALMAIAATARATGDHKLHAYGKCKIAAELAATRYGGDKFPKEEIWKNIIEQVYGPHWKGAQYSCKTTPWLKEICDSLGTNRCKHNEDTLIVSSEEVFDMFEKYAAAVETNRLFTGIDLLDERINFMVGTSNGILAPPGVGKTSLSLYMLNHNSHKDINSIFFSYDMHHAPVYLRLLQKHTGMSQDEIYHTFRHDKKKANEWKELLKKEYNRVKFCFKSGQNADDLEQTIVDTEDKIGEKVKLIVVDYNELVIAKSSDPTQASAEVAQRLRQIANDREVCVVTLLQPAKLFSNPSDEANTYQAAKGSGAIAQSLTLMLGLSRPGFHPRTPNDDKYFTINALKNRNGGLFTIDLGWDGLTGAFRTLGDEEYDALEALRQLKKEAASKSSELKF
jgi:hypothetical protein